jgi:putative MATE family efflux protein
MQDFTKGPVSRSVVKMGSFMLVSMVFQTLYFLVDLYFVGRLGKDAVAGVSLSGNLTFIVLAATQMLAVGTTSLIAQATGRKDREQANLVFNQSQVLSLLVGALFIWVMMPARHFYARALAADPATARLAVEYLTWFVPAMSLQFAMVTTGAALRGTGNFVPGMVIQSGTVLLNVVLAPVLILGWGTGRPLGVSGAALASFFAISAGVVALTVYVLRAEKYLRFLRPLLRPRLPLWGQMLLVGLPAGAEFALMGIYLMVVYSVSRPFGAGAQAAIGIVLRVVQAGFLPVVALGFAVSPVAGQNFGARLPERVRETFRVGLAFAVALMVMFTIVCQLSPEAMVRVFSRDPDVLSVGVEYLRIVSFSYVASGITFVTSSLFQAMGNTLPSLVSSSLRVLLVAIPVSALSYAAEFRLSWIWYLSMTAVMLQAACNLLFLRREFRRRLAFAPPRREAATGVEAAG